MEIQTENIKLVLREPEQVLRWIENMSPAERKEVSPDWLARVRASTSADPWVHGFALVHRASGSVIGSCAFKGPPSADGVVEIAYGVTPNHQGKGYATEAARALTAYALATGKVRVVCAHTLRGAEASKRVLAKSGFTYVGEVMDPEDGLVCRWEKVVAGVPPAVESGVPPGRAKGS
jgi:ribosomal-protein-alanine N-acetyltransferase